MENCCVGGGNLSGELGDGSFVQKLSPVSPLNVQNVVALSASNSTTTALLKNGRIMQWGGTKYRAKMNSIPIEVDLIKIIKSIGLNRKDNKWQ